MESSSPNSSSASLAFFFATSGGKPLSSAIALTNSSPVSSSYIASASGQYPRRAITRGLPKGGSPPTSSLPTLGLICPPIMRMNVVLPEPFGPSRPQMPGPRCSETSATAVTLPYHLLRRTARIEAPSFVWSLT